VAQITKRGNLQWAARIRREGQRELSKTFETKADAEAWAREVERKIKRGEIDDLDPTTQKTTITDAIQSYREKVLPTLARGGKGGSDVHLKRIDAEFGDLFVPALRSPGVNAWARSLSVDEGLSGQSVIAHLNTFSGLVRHAQTVLGVHMPAGNPLKLVTRPSPAPGRDRVLHEGEFELLIRASRDVGDGPGMAAGTMLEPIIRLAIATSMRQGELLALKWDWVDLKRATIKLPADATKNGDRREVALFSEAIEALKSIPPQNHGRVFGCWKDASSFSKPWQRTLKRAKRMYADDCQDKGVVPNASMLENLRFHDLRHHAITAFFERGLNAFQVASMSGHKSYAMLSRYTHINAQKLAEEFG
jgi:integrase